MKNKFLLFVLLIANIAWGQTTNCGFEDFENTELPTSYEDGYFEGNGGITWTYGHSRDEGDYAIDEKGIMLRNAKDSYLEATISGGIGTFSFDYRKAFTGNNVRQLELIVDGNQVATTPEFGGESGEDSTIHHFSYDIFTSETVTIKIKNVGNTTENKHTIIDNISWTCVSTDPIILTTLDEINGLGYIEGNSSTAESFSLRALNLDPEIGVLTLSATENFEISIDEINFSDELIIPYTEGTLASTDIYVRLKENLNIGEYTGIVNISGGAAADKEVILNGVVIEFLTECFSVDFADIENGHSNGTNGSSSQWNGNDDFPSVERAYQAGGAVRLGTGSATGFIESRDLNEVEGDITVNIIVKGWTTVEGDLIVSIDGQSETLTYTAVMADDFEMITASFEGVTAGSNLKIETSEKRAFIDNVEIICGEPEPVFTWNGSEDSDWNNPANWTTNEVPTADDFVIIAEDATHYPIIAEDEIAINKLKVDANAAIEIASGTLIVVDAIDVDESATFVIKDGGNLIQINDDFTNIGKIKVLKDFTFSTERNQFNFVISPVKDQNIKELFETNDYLAQKYDEETNYFEFFEDEYLGAGIGQAIEENQEGDTNQTAVFVGEPHNGTITVSGLTNGNTRFHLAGNPYPSQLDLVQFYSDNSENIESTFLFWDNRGNEAIYQQGNNYQGSNYAVFNIESGPVGTGTAAPAFGETDGKIPTQKVAVGNAFMLRLISGKDSYEFNNNQRVNGKGENFLGNAPTSNIQNRNAQSTEGNPSSTVDRYWLTLNTPNDATVMNAVVYFDGGNDGFAKDDSKITGGSDDIYTLVDEHQLKIQGKSSFDVNDKIKLGYKAFAPGIHTISIYDKEGVFADGQKIFIRDLKNDIVHELTASDFTFKTFAGEFNDRFEIFYKRSIKASENKATLSNVVIYQNENHIQIAAENQLLSDVEIYDLNGISVYQATDINLENWQVPNHLFGKGILVVVVKTADGEVVNKKIINN